MEKKIIFLAACCCLMFFTKLQAQSFDNKDAFVKSWKQGDEQITIQTWQVKLTEKVTESEKEVLAISGKKYLVSVIKNPSASIKGEHWKVLMNEITPNDKNNKDFCRDLLLADYPCDSGGDSFSSQNDIAYFYPSFQYKEGVTSVLQRNKVPSYSTDTIRKILVDGFLVVIKSGKIEFDEKDKSKVKLFELNIEFKNVCN